MLAREQPRRRGCFSSLCCIGKCIFSLIWSTFKSRRVLTSALALICLAVLSFAVFGGIKFVSRHFVRKFYHQGIDLSVIDLTKENARPISNRIIHLDMKGLPPRSSFLVELMPFLRRMGATGILMEWEDMLPFYGELEVLRSPNAYSEVEVERILTAASNNNLNVIPLVQTYNSLEYLLKHRKFSFLREWATDITTICPSNTLAIPTIKMLVEQVLSFHPNAELVHLGGTHSAKPPECHRCRSGLGAAGMVEGITVIDPDDDRPVGGGVGFDGGAGGLSESILAKHGLVPPFSPPELILSHLLPLIHFVEYRGLRPLLCDAFIRSWSLGDLETLSETSVQIVVSSHSPDLSDKASVLRNIVWNKYQSVFRERLWAGSAFKGVDRHKVHAIPLGGNAMDGSGLMLSGDYVPVMARVENHVSWLKLSSILFAELNGFIISGPTRETHMHPMSESIPAGLPPLVLCLRVLKEGYWNEEFLNQTLDVLGMPLDTPLDLFREDKLPSTTLHRYNFPGEEAFRFAEQLQAARMLQYHDLRDPNIPPRQMSKATARAIHDLARTAELLLPAVFFDSDVDELIATKVGLYVTPQFHQEIEKQREWAAIGIVPDIDSRNTQGLIGLGDEKVLFDDATAGMGPWRLMYMFPLLPLLVS